MAKVKGTVVVDIDKCKGCDICIHVCPTDVLALHDEVNGKGFHYAFMINTDECTGCVNCALVCPDSVITVYRVKPQKIKVVA